MKYQFAISIALAQSIAICIGSHLPILAKSSEVSPHLNQSPLPSLRSQQINDLVLFPEVGLAIPQPNAFSKATSFYGFEQQSTNSSIVLTKIPGSFTAVTSGFNKNALATRGISLISRQPIKIANQSGFLLKVSQSAYGQKFLKWIVVFGDEQNTHIVTATFPSKNAPKLDDSMKRTVLAVSPRPSSSTAASLPFTVTAVEGLLPVQKVTGVGKVAAFTKDGNIPTPSPTDPLLIVTPSLGAVPVGDQKSFATNRLSDYPQIEIVAATSTNEITIDNLPGWEISAKGLDRTSQTPLSLYQIVLFPKQGGYILITGIVGENQAEIYLPKFKAMALTYRNSANK